MAVVQEDRHVTNRHEKNAQPQVAVVDSDNGQFTGVWLPGNGVRQSPGTFEIGDVIPKPGAGAGTGSSMHTSIRSEHVDVSAEPKVSSNHRSQDE